MEPSNAQEMDFVVVSEDYSRYLLKDGTTLKVKIVVRKIFRVGDITPQGYPQGIFLDYANIATSIVPPSLRGPASGLFDAKREVGEEIKFDAIDEKTQEYVTNDGYKITVKPVLTKVIKYKKFNDFGEPIYSASVQAITNIERFATTATRPSQALSM
jgi:hypothetical protein